MNQDAQNSFPGIYKSIMANKSIETDREKSKIFDGIVQLLSDKAICKMNESPMKWRQSCLEYLVEILPLLEEKDIKTVCTDRESFYKRFCFSPSRKKQSLYKALQKKGPEFLDNLKITRDEIYILYSVDYGLSPFEIAEDEDILPMFIERLDDFNEREPLPLE